MAKLYIREYSDVAQTVRGAAPVGKEPGTDQAPLTINTEVKSAAFAATTVMIRVHVDAICSILIDSAPTATTSSARMAANQTEYFGVTAGHKLSVIVNT